MMNYQNTGYRPNAYQGNNNQRGFVPLIVGGVIGYGLGTANRPNYYPVPVYPPVPPMPVYPPVVIYPPYYRK